MTPSAERTMRATVPSFSIPQRLSTAGRFVSALLLIVLPLATPAFGSGGVVKLKTDGQADGYYYNAGGVDSARFITSYSAGEFDISSVICGGRYQDLNSGVPPLGSLSIELRSEDGNSPGYALLTSAGLLALADVNTASTCSTTGAATTVTFGGGAGVAYGGGEVLLTATQPADGAGALDFCGLLLDSSSVFTGDAKSQSLSPGGFTETLGINHFLELIVFDPSLQELSLRVSGSSRFPGDRGIPLMFARRACSLAASDCEVAPDPGAGVTDDFMTATMVIDNNTTSAASLDLVLEVDRSFFDPKLTPKDALGFFRPVGGGPRIMNPVTFPMGRTVLRLELALSLRQKFVDLFPVTLDFGGRLQDANDPGIIASLAPDKLAISPSFGFYDDDDVQAGNYFITQSPVLTGDGLEVRFDALDAPRPGASYRITGAEVVGAEIGASGLPGLPNVLLRTEDPVIPKTPDLSPEGLLSQSGPITMGPPATTVFIDWTDTLFEPEQFGQAKTVWVTALLNPGDSATSATAVAGDGPDSPVIGTSYVSNANAVPRTQELTTDWMIRLVVDNSASSLRSSAQEDRKPARPRTKPVSPVTLREVGKFIPLGRDGKRLDR